MFNFTIKNQPTKPIDNPIRKTEKSQFKKNLNIAPKTYHVSINYKSTTTKGTQVGDF